MKSFLTNNWLLVAIVLLAAVLHFWQLGKVPQSLNWDEASNAYNAYSILKTARDEYGNFLPLTIKSFGDYNPAMSVYTLVPSLAIFGATQFAVRFPSAFLGTLTVLCTYFLAVKLTANKKIALLSSFFLAISPWHLQFSRYDHEANFMISFAIIGFTILIYTLKKKKQALMLTTSAVFFGLALNSYQGSKIWIPLFILLVALFYLKELSKIWKKLLVPTVILFLFTLPILLNFQKSLIRGQSVGILQDKTPAETFITGYLSHFAPRFLFAQGDDNGRHSVPGMGEEYVFELPLIVLGLIYAVKSKEKGLKFLLLWLLIAPIPPSIATPTPHALRALTFIPLWSIFAAIGTYVLLKVATKRTAKYIVLAILVIVASYNILTYFHLYYIHYPKEKAPDWQDGYQEMVQYINSQKDDYEVVAVTTYYGRPYIFVLFYSQYDPAKYQKQSENKDKFDKFEFFGQSWDKKVSGPALVVRPAWQKPNPPPKYLKDIKNATGEVVFKISSE